MRALTLLALLALAALCIAGQAGECPHLPSGRIAVGAERRKAPVPYPDTLEPRREVCELNPDCDELADHIGFQEAYRRFYGPV
uniref:Osteocalcin n=1 Tax=Pan troglodytes TaxID=9598 RepID=A0A2I3RW38_PANTR